MMNTNAILIGLASFGIIAVCAAMAAQALREHRVFWAMVWAFTLLGTIILSPI